MTKKKKTDEEIEEEWKRFIKLRRRKDISG